MASTTLVSVRDLQTLPPALVCKGWMSGKTSTAHLDNRLYREGNAGRLYPCLASKVMKVVTKIQNGTEWKGSAY